MAIECQSSTPESDSAECFAHKVFQMRDDLRVRLGDNYQQTIQPIMDGLREDAKRENISVLKVFERAATPCLTDQRPGGSRGRGAYGAGGYWRGG